MKRIGVVAAILMAAVGIITAAERSAKAVKRPRISGIVEVRVTCGEPCEGTSFYSKLFPLAGDCQDCGNPPETPYGVNGSQEILLTRTRGRFGNTIDWISSQSPNRVVEVGFATDDTKLLQTYLSERGFKADFEPPEHTLTVTDPEGHRVHFFEHSQESRNYAQAAKGMKLIHAGWVVKDREAMDKFYRDVLGFHLYWQGGMKDDRVDWVSMQVPDGTDWIEYMLNIPPDANKHLLGVMNHIALGVRSVREAAAQLKRNGVKLTEEPKIGRDGKWQLNLYDPDETRVELMEFTPVEKPCCAEFTGKHPQP